MKKLIFPFLLVLPLVLTTSCNDRSEGEELQSIDPVKIDSVRIESDTIQLSMVLPIKTYSTYSSGCEGFYGYDYMHTDVFERKVVSYKFKTSAACSDPLVRVSQINFQPQQTGTFHFKFWKGKDNSGQNIWIEKSVVVE